MSTSAAAVRGSRVVGKFSDAAKEDKRVKSFLEDVAEREVYFFDTEWGVAEARKQHVYARRQVEALQEDSAPAAMMKALFAWQHARTCVVDLRSEATEVYQELDKRYAVLERYLSETYSRELSRTAKTKADRETAISAVLWRAWSARKDLLNFLSLTALFIEDIDKMGWMARTVTDVANSKSRRELY